MVGYLAKGNVHSADISGWISAENVVKVALSLYMFIYSFFLTSSLSFETFLPVKMGNGKSS